MIQLMVFLSTHALIQNFSYIHMKLNEFTNEIGIFSSILLKGNGAHF